MENQTSRTPAEEDDARLYASLPDDAPDEDDSADDAPRRIPTTPPAPTPDRLHETPHHAERLGGHEGASGAPDLRRLAREDVRRDLGRDASPEIRRPQEAPRRTPHHDPRPIRTAPSGTDSRVIWGAILAASVIMGIFGGGLLSSLFTLAIIAVVVLFLLGPFIGLYGRPELKRERFVEPVDGAQAAVIDLSLPVAETHVSALPNPDHLVEADLVYYGNVDFTASGLRDRKVSLRQVNMGRTLGMFNPLVYVTGKERLVWDVKLNPSVPTDLNIAAGAGSVKLDLSEMELTRLKLQCAVGEMKVFLPASQRRYTAVVNGGAGEMRVNVPRNAVLDLDVNGGMGDIELSFGGDTDARVRVRGAVGEVKIDLPPDLPAQIRASVGVGDLKLPPRFRKVTKEEHLVGQRGLWQTDNYREDDPAVVIDFTGGAGGLKVR